MKYGFDMVAEEYVSCMGALGGTATPYFSIAHNETFYVYGPRRYTEAEVILASRGKVRPSAFAQRTKANELLTGLELARATSKTWSMEQD